MKLLSGHAGFCTANSKRKSNVDSESLLLKESSRWKPFPFKIQTASKACGCYLLFLMKEELEIAGGWSGGLGWGETLALLRAYQKDHNLPAL